MPHHHTEPDLDDLLPDVNTGTPLVAGVTLLTMALMIGATLGVLLAYLVTGLVSALLWGMALAAVCILLAVSAVIFRGRVR